MLERMKRNVEAQQRFVADAAHQMRTPLTGLKTQAQLAFREIDPVAPCRCREIATRPTRPATGSTSSPATCPYREGGEVAQQKHRAARSCPTDPGGCRGSGDGRYRKGYRSRLQFEMSGRYPWCTPAQSNAVRLTFVLVGIWWLAFAQITLKNMPAGKPSGDGQNKNLLRNGFPGIGQGPPPCWMPVLGYSFALSFFYNMGVQTETVDRHRP